MTRVVTRTATSPKTEQSPGVDVNADLAAEGSAELLATSGPEQPLLVVPEIPFAAAPKTVVNEALPSLETKASTLKELLAGLTAAARTLTPEMKTRPIAEEVVQPRVELLRRPGAFVLPPRTIARVLDLQTKIVAAEVMPTPRVRREVAAFVKIVERQVTTTQLPAATPHVLATLAPFVQTMRLVFTRAGMRQRSDVTLPPADVVVAEKSYIATRAEELGCDVETLAQIVMFDCAKEFEEDVKALLEELKAAAKQKKALRDRLTQGKALKVKIEAELRAEYNARSQLDPENTLFIDPAKHPFSDYVKDREVAMNTPEVDNDPEAVAFEAAITNTLPQYAPWAQDLGPAPSFETLDGIASTAKTTAKKDYDSAKGAYDEVVKAFGASHGLTKEETIAVCTGAAQLGVANETAVALRRLLVDAKAEGLVAELSLSYFAGDVVAKANELAAKIDAQRKNAVASPEIEAQRTKVLETYATIYELKLLLSSTQDGTGLAQTIKDKIDALKKDADATYAKLPSHRPAEVDALLHEQTKKLAERAAAAYAADDADMRAAFNQAYSAATQERERKIKAAFALGGPIAAAMVSGAYGNITEKAVNELGATNPSYAGYVTKKKTDVIDGSGKAQKLDTWNLHAKLLDGSHVFNDVFSDAWEQLGLSRASFSEEVQRGALKRDFDLCIGNIFDDGTPNAAADQSVVFRRDDKDAQRNWLPLTVTDDAFANYGAWVEWMEKNPHDVACAFGEVLPPATTTTSYTLDIPYTDRAADEIGAPPRDPSTAVITGIDEIDALIGDKELLAPELLEKLTTVCSQRWPTKAHFERGVAWLVSKLHAHPQAAAFGKALTDRFAAIEAHRKEVVDKDNVAQFMSHDEPPKSLPRLSLAAFDVAIESLQGKLDTIGDLTQQMQLRLQLAMERRSKMYEVLSNIMKKASQTSEAIIGNMK